MAAKQNLARMATKQDLMRAMRALFLSNVALMLIAIASIAGVSIAALQLGLSKGSPK